MEALFTTGVAFSVGSLTVRWYGILISAAMVAGVLLSCREAEKQHLDSDFLVTALLLMIPSAVIGARLYYVIFRWNAWYGAHPEDIIKIWNGGLAIHGGIIFGALAVLLFCRARKENFLQWADLLVPWLALGQAIGRWGNFANHEAYGAEIAANSFWSWIPMQVFADGAYHHPTFLYESLWDVAVFIVLLWFLRRPHRVGNIFAQYLIFYSVGRFFIEMLRTDSLMLGQMRVATLTSALLILLGAFILWRNEAKPVQNLYANPAQKARPGGKKKKKKRG